MATCNGKMTKTHSRCNRNLFRCKKCDKVGCDHALEGQCSNQNFQGGKCESCGAYQKELVH